MYRCNSSTSSKVCSASYKGTQIRENLFLQITGQKPQRLAGLDRRAGQDDPAHLLLAQRRQGGRHGQIGLAGARRADAENHVVAGDGAQVFQAARRSWPPRAGLRAEV